VVDKRIQENKSFKIEMMLKTTKILKIEPYVLYCQLSNGMIKVLDIKPVFEKHSHLQGIERLKDIVTFRQAKIGEMGEVYREKIIYSNGVEWNYDISPEYILQEGKSVSYV